MTQDLSSEGCSALHESCRENRDLLFCRISAAGSLGSLSNLWDSRESKAHGMQSKTEARWQTRESNSHLRAARASAAAKDAASARVLLPGTYLRGRHVTSQEAMCERCGTTVRT